MTLADGFCVGDVVAIQPNAFEQYASSHAKNYRNLLKSMIGKQFTIKEIYYNDIYSNYCFRTVENAEKVRATTYVLHLKDFYLISVSPDVCEQNSGVASIFGGDT